MSTIQNFKNFLRHGKQARNSPHGEATTQASNVHAQQQKYAAFGAAPAPQPQHFGVSQPQMYDQHEAQQQQAAQVAPHGGYSAAAVDNRNVAAKAGDAAARAVDDQHKREKAARAAAEAQARKADYDPQVLERIVAEERESKGKLPRYPGLDRWQLLEKMGDGAFSNVYRAKDTQGQYPAEVAIKVVRKFEMNSSQVSKSSLVHHDSLLRAFHPHAPATL